MSTNAYEDGAITPNKVIFRGSNATPMVTLIQPNNRWARLEIGDVKTGINIQDLLNAARFMGAKDITTK